MQDVLPHVPFVSCPQKHLLKGYEVCHCVHTAHVHKRAHIYIPHRLFVSKSIVLPPPSCVPGGSELGGDDMCSVCIDHVS